MKTSTGDRTELVSGIKADAEKEALQLVADAGKTVSDKALAKEMQIKAIKRDTAKKIEQQVSVIEKNSHSSISVEKKRVALKVRETVINNVFALVKEKIESKMDDPNYPEVVRGWILEAAIGLGEDKAIVNGGAKELSIMDDNFLRETEERYTDLTDGKIKLQKSDKNPLFAQGVVLSSENNKTAFTNQVPTRLLRYQADIRKTIYNEIFE